jgi:putative FmdB family regulatory protein
MPTYLYECPACGEFEYEHSIAEQLDTCPRCAVMGAHITPPKVKRLIASGTNFVLSGGGWARDNYSK